MNNVVEVHRESSVLTPTDILERAVASGANVETLKQLMDLQERWQKTQARKAFDNAIAEAKQEIPVILKKREVDFTSAKGRTHYQYEDMAGIANTINPILSKHGLSYRFRSSSTPNEPITVTCIISHREGHSEETTLAGPKDESGNKNSIQGIGSTITYLQRYTLKSALGLAATADDDGKSSEAISDAQVKTLREQLDKTGADIALFCKYMEVDSIPEIPAKKFNAALAAIAKKAGK